MRLNAVALVAILAFFAMHDPCVAEDSKEDAEMQNYGQKYVNPPNKAKCACPPGFGGSPCAECLAGTYSTGGVGGTCTPCGAGLTSPAGSTSSAACLSAACFSQGYKSINIPSDGTPVTDTILPTSCYTLTLDDITEDCFSGSAGDIIVNPAGAYFIAAASVERNITVTNCITMSHDPATVEYSVDTGIVVYESNPQCVIASDALLCADDWTTTVEDNPDVYDFDAVEAICEDGGSDYAAFTFVVLEANKDYLIVNNYYDDMDDYCSNDPQISTPLVTTFSLNGAPNSIFRQGGRGSSSFFRQGGRKARTARPIPLSPEASLEKSVAALKAKHQGKMSKRAKGKKGL